MLSHAYFRSTETTVIPKSTLGKGKRTQVFQDFWRGLLLIILSNFKEMRKKLQPMRYRLHLNIFLYGKWMLHSLKLTARNSSNGNTLHYAERLASSTVNSRFGIHVKCFKLLYFFLQIFCAIIPVTWELPFAKKKEIITPNMHIILCRHLVSITSSCFLFVYLLSVAVFFPLLSRW